MSLLLRTGQVVSPIPVDDPDYDGYVSRCLRTWSVDVLTDSGDYLPNVRVINAQGNSREGTRTLPRLPSLGVNGEEIPGDLVVVAGLYGSMDYSVVLGTLCPYIEADISADEQEAEMVTTRDINETISRKEYVDTSYQRPLYMATTTRNSGLDLEHEHAGEVLVDGEPRLSHRLERVHAARSVDLEHRVQVNAGTLATIRESNTDALDVKRIHAVKSDEGVSTVTIADLQAQVLQLAHKVQELGELVMMSDKGKMAQIEHTSGPHHVLIFSDAPSKTVSTLVEDRDADTQGQWLIGPKGEVLIRRVDKDGKQTRIALNDDNTLTIQTPGGESIHLDDQAVLVTSSGSSLKVAEDTGVTMTAKDGAVVTVDEDITLNANNLSLAGAAIHLKTGGLVVGDTLAGAQSIPSAERMLQRMIQIEVALRTIGTWAQSHTHTATSVGAPTTPPNIPLPSTATPTGLFNLITDTIKSIKAV